MRLVVALGLLCLAGCAQPPASSTDVLKVNRYRVDEKEFRSEVMRLRPMFRNIPGMTDAQARQMVVDNILERQALLEEAQRLGLDRQKDFMREVESYWRQALLKVLLIRKNSQFLKEFKVPDEKVRALYERQKVQLQLEIFQLADEPSAKALSEAGAQYAGAAEVLGGKVTARHTDWWIPGDLPTDVEEKIWAQADGTVSAPFVTREHGWAVAVVRGREAVEVRPFPDVAEKLRARLARQEVQRDRDRWVRALKDRVRVEMDVPALDKIVQEALRKEGAIRGR